MYRFGHVENIDRPLMHHNDSQIQARTRLSLCLLTWINNDINKEPMKILIKVRYMQMTVSTN